ncbi:unnamed protein product [Cuscuta epithymum]|uniref:Uncharacterized protein n=1 Tax=Cuscuta epithymum TaxID=186058 RepID=A0AAV0ESD9_9ASTE|nr:unnamed protein product [Cuscuta epithymum]
MNLFSQIPGGIPYPQTSMEYSPYTPYPPYTPPPQYYSPHQNYSPTPQKFPSSYSYPFPNTQYSQCHSPNQYPYPQYPRTKPGSIMEFLIQTKSPEELVDYFPKNSICNFCGGGHHSCLCPIPPYDHPYWATAYPTSSSTQFTNTNVSVTPTSLPSYEPQDEVEEIISEKLSHLEETLKQFMQEIEASMAIQQQANTRRQNMENQLGQIIKALSEESERSYPSDTDTQPEETNMDDHVSESDYDSGNMMDDTLLDIFEDPPMFALEQEDSGDDHTETHQPFDLPLVSTPDEDGREQVRHDVDAATEVGLGIDDYKLQESGGEIDDVHNEEVPLHKQEFPSCKHAPVHSYVVSNLDFFDPFLGDDISLCVENNHNCLEDINKKSDETNWDAFMGSDTESGGEVVNFHDICEEEDDFSMVQFDYGVAPTPCFETSFELPVIPRVIKVLTHVSYPPEEDESFILHFCADEGYEDHVLPTHIREFKNLRHLMAFVERKLETLIVSAPLQSLLFESI